MSQKIEKAISKHLKHNSKVRELTGASVAEFDLESNRYGDLALSRDVGFLISIGAISDESRIASRVDVANVIRASLRRDIVLKRACSFWLGDTYMVANKFGVVTYNTLSDMGLEGFRSLHSARCTEDIKDALNAVHDGYDRRDRIFSYTKRID